MQNIKPKIWVAGHNKDLFLVHVKFDVIWQGILLVTDSEVQAASLLEDILLNKGFGGGSISQLSASQSS